MGCLSVNEQEFSAATLMSRLIFFTINVAWMLFSWVCIREDPDPQVSFAIMEIQTTLHVSFAIWGYFLSTLVFLIL